jgi:maleate isomerase
VSEDTSVGLRERFLGYNRRLATVADSFAGMALSAVCLGVTGCCYLARTDGEEAILNGLRAGGAAQAITAARALRTLLEALGRSRIGLVVPYPAWVTELATGYWRSSGVEIAEIVPLPDVVSICAVDTGKVVAAPRGYGRPPQA